mgnify:CR=1 FL=1
MLEADLECRWSRVQSRTVSYQRQYKNGTSISLVYHSNLKKGKTGSFSRIKIGQNLMDKIWDRSPSKSEVIGCCGWGRKIKWPCRTDKSNAKKRRWSNCWLSEWCVLWVQMSFYILHGMTNKSGTRSWYSRCSMKLKPKLPLTRLHRLCFFISHIMFFSWQVTFNTSPTGGLNFPQLMNSLFAYQPNGRKKVKEPNSLQPKTVL